MPALPFPKLAKGPVGAPHTAEADSANWLGYAAAGTLVAGGLLLLSGNRRAGLVAAAAGAALTMLDQKETVCALWNALPGYIDKVQGVLGQAQETVAELSAQQDRLRQILAR